MCRLMFAIVVARASLTPDGEALVCPDRFLVTYCRLGARARDARPGPGTPHLKVWLKVLTDSITTLAPRTATNSLGPCSLAPGFQS